MGFLQLGDEPQEVCSKICAIFRGPSRFRVFRPGEPRDKMSRRFLFSVLLNVTSSRDTLDTVHIEVYCGSKSWNHTDFQACTLEISHGPKYGERMEG
jgi:hypothetical protein